MYKKPKLFLILSLCIGILIGSSATWIFSKYKMHKFKHISSVEKMFMHMDRHLNLNKDQEAEILLIIKKYSQKSSDIREDFYGDMEALNDSIYKEIEPHLTKKQIEKYKKRKHRFKKSHHTSRSHRHQ